jgi:hypothetical protein
MSDPFSQITNPFTSYAKQTEETAKKLDEHLSAQVIAVFDNPQGLQLLDTLDDIYVRQPTSPPGAVKGYGYFREGQNSFILKLRAIINKSKRTS